MNLLELTKQYNTLLNDEGELSDDWETRLDQIGDAINTKLDAICRIIRQRELFIDAIDAEVDRLKKLKGRYAREAENLGKWACLCIGAEKVDTGTHRIYARESVAVEVLDEALIPPQYMREKVTVENLPDKNQIKTDLKLGADISGVSLKKNFNLVIK